MSLFKEKGVSECTDKIHKFGMSLFKEYNVRVSLLKKVVSVIFIKRKKQAVTFTHVDPQRSNPSKAH